MLYCDKMYEMLRNTSEKLNSFNYIIYLQSPKDEFISSCSIPCETAYFAGKNNLKYVAVIVDATTDSCHVEPTTFLLLYLSSRDDRHEVQKRFLMFADCS